MPDAGVLARVHRFRTRQGAFVDLEVHAGEVVLLEGPNGSGKTSLLRLLAGLPAPLPADRVEVAGRDPARMSAKEAAALVALAPQDPREGLVGLTVRGEARLRGIALPPVLASMADRDVATLSSGEARRVALAMAEGADARLLLLDEPTEGLDAQGLGRLLEALGRARLRGAVVVADHSGLLAPVATRRLALGATAVHEPVSLPPPGQAPVVRLDAGDVLVGRGRPGATTVRFPPFAFPAGFHVVAGPNGSGKSTLLLRLAGLRGEGVHLLGGAPEPGRSARLLLPHAGDLFTAATVREELAEVAPPPGLVAAPLLDRHPLALSAGEAERVALAKTLCRRAELYLLDEPEAHLDSAGRVQLLQLVAQRVADGACVVAATHDEALIAMAHSTLRLGGAS